MTDFQFILIDLLVILDAVEVTRLIFMLYAKFKPYFHKDKEGH